MSEPTDGVVILDRKQLLACLNETDFRSSPATSSSCACRAARVEDHPSRCGLAIGFIMNKRPRLNGLRLGRK